MRRRNPLLQNPPSSHHPGVENACGAAESETMRSQSFNSLWLVYMQEAANSAAVPTLQVSRFYNAPWDTHVCERRHNAMDTTRARSLWHRYQKCRENLVVQRDNGGDTLKRGCIIIRRADVSQKVSAGRSPCCCCCCCRYASGTFGTLGLPGP